MIRKDIKDFLNTIPNDVTVVAATKYIDSFEMKDLFNSGISDFGENRVDSFLEKYDQLNNLHIIWHFIGHLQTNKAKLVINKINYLHSLDSLKLAEIINKNRETPLNCFIEVSVNKEENKNGVHIDNLINFVEAILKFKNIKLVGFMMMAIKDSNEFSLEKQFSKLKELKDQMENKFQIKIPYLSMGMSDDYNIAIKCGATHIRLGRILYKQ